MTPGVPGAGIGGLFYIASTLLLPFRSLARRVRGQPDSQTAGQIAHSVAMAGGVIAAMSVTGWLLALLVPDELLRTVPTARGGTVRARTVLPVATFATAVVTLVAVLAAVEVARYAQSRRQDYLDPRKEPRR